MVDDTNNWQVAKIEPPQHRCEFFRNLLLSYPKPETAATA